MINLKTPRGLPVNVPETEDEDPSPKFAPSQIDAVARYYAENGYAIIRGVVDPIVCDRLKDLWASEIKPSGDFFTGRRPPGPSGMCSTTKGG